MASVKALVSAFPREVNSSCGRVVLYCIVVLCGCILPHPLCFICYRFTWNYYAAS